VNLTNKLKDKKYTTNQLQVDNVYGNYDMRNVEILLQSHTLKEAFVSESINTFQCISPRFV